MANRKKRRNIDDYLGRRDLKDSKAHGVARLLDPPIRAGLRLADRRNRFLPRTRDPLTSKPAPIRTPQESAKPGRLKALTDEYLKLAERLRAGGGPERVAKMHGQGKLSPRERVEQLRDPGTPWLEVGLLVAYDRYDGQAPGAGVITGVGVVEGRETVVVANDATVKAGAWWPETIGKILRAQETAMRQRSPIVCP